jgi:hypothetical protein
MRDRRTHSRVLMWKTGKLSIADDAPTVECAILDMSDSGACILVPIAANIPATFSLMIDGLEGKYDCSLKWKRGARLGLEFQTKRAAAEDGIMERQRAISEKDGSSVEAWWQPSYPSRPPSEHAMTRFEDLPGNVRALLLARLAIEMNAQKALSIYHLAKIREVDAGDLWRSICRKAGQPPCTLPIEALRRHG